MQLARLDLALADLAVAADALEATVVHGDVFNVVRTLDGGRRTNGRPSWNKKADIADRNRTAPDLLMVDTRNSSYLGGGAVMRRERALYMWSAPLAGQNQPPWKGFLVSEYLLCVQIIILSVVLVDDLSHAAFAVSQQAPFILTCHQ